MFDPFMQVLLDFSGSLLKRKMWAASSMGHGLEWLTLRSSESREPSRSKRTDSAVLRLCEAIREELVASMGSELSVSYTDLCHAARALRQYAERAKLEKTD